MPIYRRKYSTIIKGLTGRNPSRTGTNWWSAPDWLNLAAMLVALGFAVWSVDQAGWIRPSTSLTAVLVLAALTGAILVKSGLRWFVIHPLALFAGLIVVFIQGLFLLPDPGLQLKVLRLVSDLQVWWHAQMYGAPSPVNLHIALIFGYISWLTGYFSAWSLLKKGTPWIAVVLGIVIVLVNLNFWRHDKYYLFLVYIIAALVFLCVVAYLKNRSMLSGSRFRSSPSRPVWWLATSLCIIVVSVSLTWTSPGFKISPIGDYARAHDPFRGKVELYWQSFFAPVPGNKVPTLSHGGQQDLFFGGPLELSDQVVFIINTDRHYYWKTQVYDEYTSTGWKNGAAGIENIRQDNSSNLGIESSSASKFIYTLIPQVTTDVLPSVGEFEAASIPVIEKVLTPLVFTFSLLDSSGDSGLPPDIAAAAASLRAARSNRRRTDQQISALLPSGLQLKSVTRSGLLPQTVTVSRLETEEKTVVALSSAAILLQQKRASIAVIPPLEVDETVLKDAGQDYPNWLTDRYLQLPPDLPDRIKALAAEVTQKASTPYQKAQDIKKYLGNLRYDISISAPPEGEDGVDYFLFTQKAGYCNYFASAATVMLRSAGIPARMVVGFMPGQYDESTHSYIIRDRDYHAWIEVYYPGQGWVEMDVTPPRDTSVPLSNTGSGQSLEYPLFPNYPDSGQISSSAAAASPAQSNHFSHLFLFLTLYVLTVLGLIAWFHYSNRPRNKTSLYSRMVLLASIAGLGPRARNTELEFSRQLALALPAQAETITGIARSYMQHHYGREGPALPMEVEFKKTWPDLRQALFRRIFRLPFHTHLK